MVESWITWLGYLISVLVLLGVRELWAWWKQRRNGRAANRSSWSQ
jgi:hypothetical protein